MALAACGGSDGGSSANNTTINTGRDYQNIEETQLATINSNNIEKLTWLAMQMGAPTAVSHHYVLGRIMDNELHQANLVKEGGCITGGSVKVVFSNFQPDGKVKEGAVAEITANKCIDDMNNRADGYSKITYAAVGDGSARFNLTYYNYSDNFKDYYTGGTTEYINTNTNSYVIKGAGTAVSGATKMNSTGTMELTVTDKNAKTAVVRFYDDNYVTQAQLGKVQVSTTEDIMIKQDVVTSGKLMITAANGNLHVSLNNGSATVIANYDGKNSTVHYNDFSKFMEGAMPK